MIQNHLMLDDLPYCGNWIMKAAMPPERWTPKGEDPQEHYRRIFAFE